MAEPQSAGSTVDAFSDIVGRVAGFLDMLYVLCFDFFRIAGLFYRSFLHNTRRRWRVFYQRYLQKYMHRLDLARLRVVKFFSRVKRHLFYRFYMFLKFFVDAWQVVRGGFNRYPKRNPAVRLGYAFLAFCRGVRCNFHFFVTIFNWAFPTVMVVLFVNLVGYVMSLNYVVDVNYKGEHIGFIRDESVYNQAESALMKRVVYLQSDAVNDQLPTFEVTIAQKSEMAAADILTDTMMQLTNVDAVYGMGVWVDNEFYGVVRDGENVETALEEQLNQYKTGNPTEKLSFDKNITLSRGYYQEENFVASQEILTQLSTMEEQDVYDTIRAGDAPSLIAQRNDMTLDELVALNPDILEDCQIGHTVKVHSSKPFLPVKRTRRITYTEEIPFSVNKYNSPNLWQGTSQVTTKGEPGERSVTADLAEVDGVEVSRDILETTVLTEPVTQQVAVGTKVMPKVANISGAKVSSYGLIWPTQQSTAYISQHYGNVGYSYGGVPHRGCDIGFRGNGYGSAVLAVLPGTVTYSGWNGTYGNFIKIDHGNGLVTCYGHNSKLQVRVGQTVAQGQVIANAGSTGRSFGTHIHFELYLNGARQNPERYLP